MRSTRVIYSRDIPYRNDGFFSGGVGNPVRPLFPSVTVLSERSWFTRTVISLGPRDVKLILFVQQRFIIKCVQKYTFRFLRETMLLFRRSSDIDCKRRTNRFRNVRVRKQICRRCCETKSKVFLRFCAARESLFVNSAYVYAQSRMF